MNRKPWDALFETGHIRDELFMDIERRYREEWRYYHVAEHVDECLALLEENSNLASKPEEVTAAFYFHDAVYIPGASDNEDRSAELAYRSLCESGWNHDRARAVAELVSSTAHLSDRRFEDRFCTKSDRLLLHDIDLAVLGSPPERYARYARDVRAEHAHVTDDDYARGRSRVIGRFLLAVSIYALPHFTLRFESAARSNLKTELDMITSTRNRNELQLSF